MHGATIKNKNKNYPPSFYHINNTWQDVEIMQAASCNFLPSLPIYSYFWQSTSLRTTGKISHPQKMAIYFEWFVFMFL